MSNASDNNSENNNLNANQNPNETSVNQDNKYYIDDYSMNVTYEEFETCKLFILNSFKYKTTRRRNDHEQSKP